jgi:hypothetical protein
VDMSHCGIPHISERRHLRNGVIGTGNQAPSYIKINVMDIFIGLTRRIPNPADEDGSGGLPNGVQWPPLGAVGVESQPVQGNLVDFIANDNHSSIENSELLLVEYGEL